jgi:UDP-N-acetylglucosamine 4,6-dehydratase
LNNVLITGGTGFFGRAFTEELLKTNAERICIYSRNEYNQYLMRKQFKDDERMRFLIGDIRDKDRLSMALRGIDTVVHAAALKRTEVCQYNIFEAVNTNVVGTENLIKACIEQKVGKAVFLSSDKACNPTTTYGFTKALGEDLFLKANLYSNTSRFSVTRYGNVANSTGSVIPIWQNLLKTQDFVPVTDPDCTRFWMSAQQAVYLVLATINIMKGGELAIPELQAFSVRDLATAIGAKEMKIIGLAQDEKRHEQMKGGETSDTVRRMSVEELKTQLALL